MRVPSLSRSSNSFVLRSDHFHGGLFNSRRWLVIVWISGFVVQSCEDDYVFGKMIPASIIKSEIVVLPTAVTQEIFIRTAALCILVPALKVVKSLLRYPWY